MENKNSQNNEPIISINQSAIARKLNISSSYVSLILSGKRHSKRYETRIQYLIKKAVDALNNKAA